MKNMIFSPTKIDGAVRIPSSKSQAHRALICAALAGNSVARGVDLSNDVNVTANALRKMGAELTYDAASRTFTAGKPCARGISVGELDAGESASMLRFFIPLVSALGIDCTFVGGGRLPKRPTDLYKPLMEAHGASLTYPENGDYLPLPVSGRLTGGTYALRGDVSSQFVTGLLLALTQVEGESEIKLTTRLESKPYADLTVDVLRQFGADITEHPEGYTLRGGMLKPLDLDVEGDCSQAAFFTVAAAIGGRVTLTGLRRDTKQGDFKLFEIAEQFGAGVTWDGDTVTVRKADKLTAHDIDAADIPDLVPALAVMAAFSEGTTRIYNAARLRIKESDRIASTLAMIRAIGGMAEETPDSLIVTGQKTLPGGCVQACNDHRIAMASAAASAGCMGDVIVDDMSCINKSYPEFVQDFHQVKAGAPVR